MPKDKNIVADIIDIGDDTTNPQRRIRIGKDNDLNLYHYNDSSHIENNTGHLVIENKNNKGKVQIKLGTTSDETDFQIVDSSGTEIFNVDGSGGVSVPGNLTTGTHVDNSTIEDLIIELGNGRTGDPSDDDPAQNPVGDCGIVMIRGDTGNNNAFMGFDDSENKFIMGTGSFTGASSGNLTITPGTLQVAGIEGPTSLTLTSTSGTMTINGAGQTIDVDCTDIDIDATNDISLDAGAASNFTTSAGALTLDGAGGVNIQGNASEIDVTTTGALDLNSGAFTLNCSTSTITSTDTTSLSMEANSANAKTLTIDASNSGAGTASINIGTTESTSISIGHTTSETTVNDNLNVTGDTSVSTFDSSGATSLATGGGAVNIASTGEMTTVKGTLNVDEAVTLDSTLDVTGDTSVSTFDSSGATSLATGGGAVNIASTGVMTTVKGTLNVDQAVTLDSTLDVTGILNAGTLTLDDSGITNSSGTISVGDNFFHAKNIKTKDLNNNTWSQIGSDIDGEAQDDNSGFSVSMNANGNIVAIGATGNSSSTGHVRVYKWNGSLWTQLGSDIDGELADDNSGFSVSLSSDGNIVAIGAPYNDGNGASSGHVRVYEYNGSAWVQLGSDIDGEAAADQSGYSVSLSANGNIVAIGARVNGGNGASSGHVRVYQYNSGGNAWSQLGSDIDGEASQDLSGHSVSLSANGKIVAIGAIQNSGTATNAGHVRVYQYNGSSWSQLGSDIDGEAQYDQSGISVSLSSNGQIVAIGANQNDGSGNNAGHVRVYEYSGSSWIQLGSDIDGESADDQSGYSVSLSANGNIVAIGSRINAGGGTSRGHVKIFQLTGSSWNQIGSDIDGEADNDNSGSGISLNASGSLVAIGAINNDGTASNAGHVRVYGLGEYISSINTGTLTANTIQSDANTNLVIQAATGNQGIITLAQAFNAIQMETDSFIMTSSNASNPLVLIKNTTDDANPPRLTMLKERANPADDDECGAFAFSARDDANNETRFAEIKGIATVVTSGSERGQLSLSVAEFDGNLTSGLTLYGTTTNGQVDATLGAGTASTTTIAGTLDVTGTVTANSGIESKNGASGSGFIDLYEDSDNGTNKIRIIAPSAVTSDITLTLPDGDGDADQVLTTNGSGTLSWATASSNIDELTDGKSGGANFTNSMILGHETTGTLDAAERNTAIGIASMDAITSGDDNVCVGHDAGGLIDSGSQNTCIGSSAGDALTTGSNNTIIGYNAAASDVGATNEITLGDANIDTIRSGATTIASLSDRRDKTNIVNSNYGLNFIEKLRPVEFTWKRRILNKSDENNSHDGKNRLGFIAQEIQEAMPNKENDILDLVYESNPERLEVKQGNLVPILVKAIQELQAQVNILKKQLEN